MTVESIFIIGVISGIIAMALAEFAVVAAALALKRKNSKIDIMKFGDEKDGNKKGSE
ncbi:hypothetical protein [Caproicibacterium amylolyticum]|uniref:Uncharacterized protein n=1 Tax=Caproicibacterium amylolyticum TaxID=2766537 RepID=A0A7G9WJT8_9FIRM|nr:hypothetical protein [Caproicibacterium amylolyticum]QNO18950.1 hypothetical protein H6X83_04810 [Caproicibacterium amylolyticum]